MRIPTASLRTGLGMTHSGSHCEEPQCGDVAIRFPVAQRATRLRCKRRAVEDAGPYIQAQAPGGGSKPPPYYFFTQVVGMRAMRMGKISNRPRSMARDSSSLDQTE